MKGGGIVRVGVAVLVLLAIVALVITVSRINPQAARTTALFQDGSHFMLLATTRGNERFSTQKPWQEYAGRWLPRKLCGWLPDPFKLSVGAESNTATVWFTLLGVNGANVSAVPWTWNTAVDSNGFHFPSTGGGGLLTASRFAAGRRTVHAVTLKAFPRRQSEFDVEFRDRDWRLLGSIHVRNPVHGPFPEWRPEKMPFARTNGPIVVTLESLIEQTNGHSPYSLLISPKWKLESSDPSWRDAEQSHYEFSDPTGNRGGHLGFSEHAWKLALPFRRGDSTNYSADEKFILPNLAVPRAGTFQVLRTNFERLGVKFAVLALSGAGTLAITNGTDFGMTAGSRLASGGSRSWNDGHARVEEYSSGGLAFLTEFTQPDPLDQVRFRLIANDGREIPLTTSTGYGSSRRPWRHHQRFDAPEGISNISLEVIVSRARLLEFTIDPADVRRLNATNK